jgi:hypothetical protein
LKRRNHNIHNGTNYFFKFLEDNGEAEGLPLEFFPLLLGQIKDYFYEKYQISP